MPDFRGFGRPERTKGSGLCRLSKGLLAVREGPLALWHPITDAPENMGDRSDLVSDGIYIEKALRNGKTGWRRTGDGEARPWQPQPAHWLSEAERLRGPQGVPGPATPSRR